MCSNESETLTLTTGDCGSTEYSTVLHISFISVIFHHTEMRVSDIREVKQEIKVYTFYFYDDEIPVNISEAGWVLNNDESSEATSALQSDDLSDNICCCCSLHQVLEPHLDHSWSVRTFTHRKYWERKRLKHFKLFQSDKILQVWQIHVKIIEKTSTELKWYFLD